MIFLKIVIFCTYIHCSLIPNDVIMRSENYSRVKVNVNLGTKFQVYILFSFQVKLWRATAENKRKTANKGENPRTETIGVQSTLQALNDVNTFDS